MVRNEINTYQQKRRDVAEKNELLKKKQHENQTKLRLRKRTCGNV